MQALRFHVPGNPWQGSINKRDRASARGSKPHNYKKAGFRAYQDHVAACCRRACAQQQVRFPDGDVEIWIEMGVPDRRRRDVDSPLKAIFDGITDGGGWTDDCQAWRAHPEKVLGQEGARVVIRPIVDRPVG